MTKKERKTYTKRVASEYNIFRTFFQFLVCKIGYMIRFKLVYNLKVEGIENIPADNNYIVCANHLSTLDPPLLCAALPRAICFMAKKELFDIKFIRWWLDWLGAFAVDRESLGPSTIKTAMEIKKTSWVLGIFPQGTRGVPGEIRGVNKGFAGLAKLTKCNILPVGIVGTEQATHIPFNGHITMKIGKIIPYDKNPDVVRDKWIEAIQELTGFKYVKNDEVLEKDGVKDEKQREKL